MLCSLDSYIYFLNNISALKVYMSDEPNIYVVICSTMSSHDVLKSCQTASLLQIMLSEQVRLLNWVQLLFTVP